MATEIERKFLPKDPDWRPSGKAERIVQGYFWINETATAHIHHSPRDAFSFILRPRDSKEWALKLPADDGAELLAANPHYLSRKWTVRVRQSSWNGGFLTLKGSADESKRERPEYEYPLSKSATRRLLDLTKDTHILKDRFHLPYKKFTWDVDVYLGHLAESGLVTCEIELPRRDTNFPLPDWVGPEVTSVSGYSNAALARRLPIPKRPA